MTEKIVFENGRRKALIKETRHRITVFFYYDGYPDTEWKRGSHGVVRYLRHISKGKSKS